MRSGTPPIGAVARTLDFLEAIVADGGAHNVRSLAEATGLPHATAHRQVRTLIAQGYLTPIAKGLHVAGPRLIKLGTAVDPLATLVRAARPMLHQLARSAKGTAHLGVLENDMVTYLVKVGSAGEQLFTQEGKQLEAYCSGIGKVLLAYLGEAERERYLADGPFTALTPKTITDPELLRTELAATRARGFAIDDEEIAPSLQCVAVPLLTADGTVCAAISVTKVGAAATAEALSSLAATLRGAAHALVLRVLG
ncbi:IclR family transcriptional regulator [Novosphingobium sp. Chol11]|uniref:IclR family transcriptional regulator n=1 Tax=Novosphingobium sp. Chol11 TaxID=1385763 RepID=UPI0025E2F320|nr:IclR family transcriptional regulator [Novosphingobium sp. Chol11]